MSEFEEVESQAGMAASTAMIPPRRPGRPKASDDQIVSPPEPMEQMRPNMRPSTARELAEERARQILDGGLNPFEESAQDEFRVDADIIPDGWSYEWKRYSTLNQEDPSYISELARHGWTPVPRERHPEFMPLNSKSKVIERKGLVLMERPAQITEMYKQRDFEAARRQNMLTKEKLRETGPNEFARNRVEVSRNYEHVPIPK